MAKIRPLNDRVVVKCRKEKTTSGGIVIPENATEKQQLAEVIAVGPGKVENGQLRQLGVKVGDQVLFGKYSGTEFKIDGEELLVLREEDIMGVVQA